MLTANSAQAGADEDTNLVNGWGLAAAPDGPWWVASNEMRLATVITDLGAPETRTVEIPGAPTGIVFSGGRGFMIGDGEETGEARFLFATEAGTIAGWSPDVPAPGPSTQAFITVDNRRNGAVYKGLAIATTSDGERLYAADFKNGRIDVFDVGFAPVRRPGAFADRLIPEGFAPFNVQTLNGRVFVAYAKRDPATNDEVKGQGLGMVDAYDTEGRLIARVAARGALNAPWGLAIAPPGFGDLDGRLLVGNFGDGKILAFRMTDDLVRSVPDGVMRDEKNRPIVIDGLWGIAFGHGGASGSPGTLFFAAGPHDEELGLFGSIAPVP
jgi:uncharacterized protein (TIGR03118 family)